MESTLGSRLSEARKTKKLTMQSVADSLGIARTTYSGYESNYREPDAETLARLANLFQVTTDYLLGLDDNFSFGKIESSVHTAVPTQSGFSKPDFVILPIVAEISCEQPIFTKHNIIGHFPADRSMINGGEYVWLRAKGESMIGAGIEDDSLVLVRLQPEVENNERAAVCVDNDSATLKKILYADENIILIPENPNMSPEVYPADRLRIVGKAIYTVKKL